MTLASTDCRGEVIDRLIELLQAHENLTSVTVEPEFPDDSMGSEAIYIIDVEGDEVSIPTMTAGRKMRDDRFRLVFGVGVSNRGDYSTTRQRVSEIVGAVEDVLAADPGLGGTIDSLISAEVTNINGPLVGRTDQGRVGIAEVTVSCFCRLS